MQKLDYLLQTVRTFSSNVQMQFGISTCAKSEELKLCKKKEYNHLVEKR